MSSIKEMEHIVNDYEKRIESLKQLEKELIRLPTDGFEKESHFASFWFVV